MMLERTSGLLADLTDCTAMVVGPSHESAAIRSVQLVGLGPRLALLVVVLADGAVQKQSVEFADEVDEAPSCPTPPPAWPPTRSASPLTQVAPNAAGTGDPTIDAVVGAGLKAPALARCRPTAATSSSSGDPRGWWPPSTPWRRCARC